MEKSFNRPKSTAVHSTKLAGPGWQVQTAKARFSELFRLVRTKGPQLITRQGKEGVVMMPVEQFEKLTAPSRRRKNLVQFFRESPLVGLDLEFERDRDTGREIEL